MYSSAFCWLVWQPLFDCLFGSRFLLWTPTVLFAKGRALVTDSYRRLPHTIYTRQLRADRKLSIRRDPRHPPYPLTPQEKG